VSDSQSSWEHLLPLGGRGHVTAPLTPVASRSVEMPLAGRDRAAWRLATLLLILRSCRGRAASVKQLHVLTWALRDESNGQTLLQRWNEARPRGVLRAYDPVLDDTLALGRAAGLIAPTRTGRIEMSPEGGRVVDSIRATEGLMEDELRFLARLGTISESRMWERLGIPDREAATQRGNTR
jgi:hypothetical protein